MSNIEDTTVMRALRLAEGRLALLLIAYPELSEICDHPTATRYVLAKVREAINELHSEDGQRTERDPDADYGLVDFIGFLDSFEGYRR